ncbi:hypothetical protein KR009_001363 [Drosophila setifemur]|nr:hypothetical protein KR009_001363 [Drosophila setifemur]
MFSVTSVGAILAVESKMRNPEKFLGWVGMLGRTTIAVLICYVFFGILGYWKYVVEVEGAVSLNLPTNEIVSNAIKVLFALAIFLSYPLTGYVFIQIIMTRYWNKNNDLKHPHCMEYLLRCIFLLITTSNALLFPNLIPMMTLVGSFSISILNLIGPALLDFCLCYSNGDYGKMRWKLLRALAFIILGIVLLLVGVIYAFMDMIDDFGGAGGLTTDEPPISSPEPDTTLAEAAGGEAAPEAEGFLRFLRGNPIFKP